MEEVYSLRQPKTSRLAHYDINIGFLHGKENLIADALSRVCPLQSNNSKIKESNINVISVHHIMQSALISKTRLQELRLATQSDPTLYSLSKTIHEGWPQSVKKMEYSTKIIN